MATCPKDVFGITPRKKIQMMPYCWKTTERYIPRHMSVAEPPKTAKQRGQTRVRVGKWTSITEIVDMKTLGISNEELSKRVFGVAYELADFPSGH